MQIFVSRQGRQLGPFSPEELQEGLKRGEVALPDLAWHEGASGWEPLSVVLSGRAQGAVLLPPAYRAKSMAGTVSLVIAVVTLVSLGVALGLAVVMAMRIRSGGPPFDPVGSLAVGFAILAGGFGNLLGLILGIVGLCRAGSSKVVLGLGIFLNIIQLFSIAGLIGLGLMMTGSLPHAGLSRRQLSPGRFAVSNPLARE